MKTIFLTGASGFIGYYVAKLLLESGNSVIAPIRAASMGSQRVERLQALGLKVISGQFNDEKLLEKSLNPKIDFIIHIAAIRGEISISTEQYKKINVFSAETLLKKAAQNRIPNFIYCSSVGVQGTIPKNQPARFDDAVAPDNRYHQSKWEAEQIVNRYNDNGISTCILRPTVTYGSGDDGFLPRLVSLVQARKFPKIKPSPQIHLLSVNAFAELILCIIEKNLVDGNTYIVADANPVSLNELVLRIANKIQIKPYPFYLSFFPEIFIKMLDFLIRTTGNKGLYTSLQLITKNWTYDITNTINTLGYQPVNTADSIDSTIKEILNV